MSRRLTEEAEKYIEDFISNVEDTDISSLDGERSDNSSTFGAIPTKTNSFTSSAVTKSTFVEMDGVTLPWLQWETSNDASPLSCKNSTSTQVTPYMLSNYLRALNIQVTPYVLSNYLRSLNICGVRDMITAPLVVKIIELDFHVLCLSV